MKRITSLTSLLLLAGLALVLTSSEAQAQTAPKGKPADRGFIDANGDGINDRALDADNDGVPNGKDPDFVRPMDGSGRKYMRGAGKAQNGSGRGKGIGPQDGSGQCTGTGVCDGTGPKGARAGKGKGNG
ncbi:MAG: hypothetical protein MUE68_06805 [Bacteroidetes bacterium]|jgi:hypothetical protein|nr:hypothetical protein [Bacteroidota bacterium]